MNHEPFAARAYLMFRSESLSTAQESGADVAVLCVRRATNPSLPVRSAYSEMSPWRARSTIPPRGQMKLRTTVRAVRLDSR